MTHTHNHNGGFVSAGNRQANHRKLLDTDDFRITLWTFQPGERTGMHAHVYPYVVVPLTAGRFTIAANGGGEQFETIEEQPYYRPPGARHDLVANNGSRFLEIEIKAPAG